jgi:hypothetical protein
MGMSGDRLFSLSPSTQEILTTLDNAEKLFWSDLALVARRGRVSRVRDATVSLAMIKALQTSLGKARRAGPVLTASLLSKNYAKVIFMVTNHFAAHRRIYCDHAAPRVTRGYPAEVSYVSGVRRLTMASDNTRWFPPSATQNAHASSNGLDRF